MSPRNFRIFTDGLIAGVCSLMAGMAYRAADYGPCALFSVMALLGVVFLLRDTRV